MTNKKRRNKKSPRLTRNLASSETTNQLEQAMGHHRQNNLREAENIYRAILMHEPAHADALHLLGLTYAQRELHTKAVDLYTQALSHTPTFPLAYNNRGIFLNIIGEFSLAIDNFRKSLVIEPNNADTHNNLGNVLSKINRRKEAIKHYKKAIQINPNHTDAYCNLGNAHNKLSNFDAALESYRQALALNPKHTHAFNGRALMLRILCDWNDFDAIETEMVNQALQPTRKLAPFHLLSWSDDPKLQHQCAINYTKNIIPPDFPKITLKPSKQKERTRIGYISADFCHHVVSHIIAELFEKHDKNQFEIFGFSLGINDNSPIQKRLEISFEHFIEVGHLADHQVAQLIADQGIQILVDLTGYSMGARTRILAMRPAPIQISYLGYIGTMGADFIDYILVDETSVPNELQPFFTEKLIHLPCYMVNDSQRKISTEMPTRTTVGLPEEAFVFCCFNNSYKITPEIFDIWMRCLTTIPNSVLWLLSAADAMQDNLRKEAQARGVSADRLIFAPRIETSKHLARHRLADLFLDTLPVNAGATASDALWVGLPVLTCMGNSFSARMCGGLLHAVGLSELAVDTLEEYEAFAIKLASEPAVLRMFRDRLKANRDSALLFDSDKFCRNLEQLFSNLQRGQDAKITASGQAEKFSIAPKKVTNNKHTHMNIDKLFKKATTLHHKQNLKKAREIYQQILSQDATHAGTLHYMGILHAQQEHPLEAIEFYKKSIEASPNISEVHNNLGVSLNSIQRQNEALVSFQKAIESDPKNAEACNNAGGVLGYLERQSEAKHYFLKALEIMPDHDEAHYNLAVLLGDQKDYDTAKTHYLQHLKINPNHFNALNNIGTIYAIKKQYEKACHYFKKSLKLKPYHANALSQLAINQRQCCDWSDFEQVQAQLSQWQQKRYQSVPNPFSFLLWADSPQAQQQCARVYTQSNLKADIQKINACPSPDDTRIRIAYISADFREHPISYLTAELYELHDRSQFEITAIAYGAKDSSPMRQRLLNAFDHFYDVDHLSDIEVAELIASKGIHIIIDLVGLTQGNRVGVLARRPAPIQINYLGYVGTMGADYIDYIIVDKFSVPPDQQPFFDEQLLHLPCYMVIDTQREISTETPTRIACGLPNEGFVFCSFNNSYKITPELFEIWMRCLGKVAGSVLWLLGDNEWAMENLRNEAKKWGIDPARLIFAPRTDAANHLARHRLADLFLDTRPVNAGATASDALWMGLPLLTCAGESFVARMGGGLLHAAGLPELVTHTLEEYEAMAVELATTPEKLATLREKLIANRNSAPLFNSKAFCQNFEQTLVTLWHRWRDALDKAAPQTVPLQAMLEEAVALHQQGNLDTAEEKYQAILKINPQEADALHLLGAAHAQRGNIDKAVSLYRQSIEANPTLFAAYNNLGIALHSSNRTQEAMESFRRAIEIKPNVDAYYNLGNCLYGLQQYEEAVASYQQALAIDPNHAYAQRNMKASLKQLER